ncbi:MAG: TrbC/VirB2 family protein [Erythrobacter sp.]
MIDASLFEAADLSLPSALGWLDAILLGLLATTLCVVGVALLGFTMLTGRLSLRFAGRTVIGVCVLLGAPLIAGAFVSGSSQQSVPANAYVEASPQPPRDLPPSDVDPNAGASLRRD